ncbi:MAG: hypothetical protein U0R51_06115 [Solirubrobacterales bacterium]
MRRWAAVVAALAVALTLPITAAHGSAITQPPQPKHGPGGSDYSHAGFRVHQGGTGADAFYVFEPTRPEPKRAPLAIISHGYYEYSGYAQMEGLIEHTVRHGSVVIYPRWQTGVATPCPGPYFIEPCIDSEVAGITGGIDFLHAKGSRVQPDLGRAGYFGFSFGGIITANVANRWRELGVPKPRAIFLDDPHDGGLAGAGEPALDDSLAGIPKNAKVECHSGAGGVLALDGPNESCNSLFPLLGSIPQRNKDLVLTKSDLHGTPGLSSAHGVCAGGSATPPGPPDAYDWNFCWSVWDALRSCAFADRDCEYALGEDRRHTSLGRWSDGTPVAPLKVRNAAPIRP